jgi:hypothetical protein
MKFAKFSALALLLMVVWATGALAWDTRFEVYADSTLAGIPGFLMYVDEADPGDLDQTIFLATGSGQLRVVGIRDQGDVDWFILPMEMYLGPGPDQVTGDTWDTLPDDLGRLNYSTFEEIENTTVPAGSFTAALCLSRPYDLGGQGYPVTEAQHFVSGIGLIRDYWLIPQDADELVSYNIAGGSGHFPLAVGNWWEYQYNWDYSYPLTPAGELPGTGHLLLGNAPNPFNPSTEISFVMGQADHARLKVYDIAGNLVRTLVDEQRDAGSHTVTWNGRDDSGRMAATGVYLYRFEAGDSVQTRRMTLVK